MILLKVTLMESRVRRLKVKSRLRDLALAAEGGGHGRRIIHAT